VSYDSTDVVIVNISDIVVLHYVFCRHWHNFESVIILNTVLNELYSKISECFSADAQFCFFPQFFTTTKDIGRLHFLT